MNWLRNPIVVSGLFSVAILWGVVLYRAEDEQGRKEHDIAIGALNIAKALEQTVADSVNQLDSLLKIIRDLKEKNFDSRSWASIVDPTYVKNTVAIQLAVTDAEGYTVTTTNDSAIEKNGLSGNRSRPTETETGQGNAKRLNFRDREHFSVHVNSRVDSLFISKPVLGRGTGRQTLQLTRRIWNADGTFGGVLLASLDPGKLVRTYGDLNLGAGGGVAIVGDDDIFRAGTGVFSSYIGRAYRESKILSEMHVQGYAGSKENHTVVKESFEGTTRFVVMRRVVGYPLTVIVAVADPNGEEFVNNSTMYYGLAIFGTLIVLIAVLAILRYQSAAIRSIRQRNEMELEKKLAESSAADRGLFLAVMSHEIRTPLNGVLGALDILRDEKLSERGRRCVSIATTSGEALLGLIDDVLLITKSEFDRIDLASEPFVLGDLLCGVRDAMGPAIAKNNNTFTLKVGAQADKPVLGDARRLEQVLFNLVGNANKFTSGGTITIEVDALSSDATGLGVRIAVIDSGVGIPKDKQNIIFNTFKTLDPGYSRRTDGTGLGLAICDKLVRAMGGRLVVDSEVGRGSKFSFAIQFAYAPGQQQELKTSRAEEHAKPTCGALKILLAEDNQTNAYVATELLMNAGHHVCLAADGREAVAMAADQRFDIILMDVSMPEMDGIEATAMIRSTSPLNATTPIVALTAHAVEGDRNRFLAAKMNGYITKPIRRNIFLETIAAVRSGVSEVEDDGAQAQLGDQIIDKTAFIEFLSDRSADRAVKTISIFVAELDKVASKLQQIIASRDRAGLEMLAHSALGSGSMLGAARMANLSRKIEGQCKRGEAIDWSAADELLATLNETASTFAALGGADALDDFMGRMAVAA